MGYRAKQRTPLVNREMQIKMTLRFYLTPVRMAEMKNSSDITFWQGCGTKGTFIHCWGDCKLVKPFWKSIWQFHRKLGLDLPQDPVIQFLGIYLNDALPY